MLKIPAKHIEPKNSSDSKLQTFSICSVRILNILKVIAKMRTKMLNPAKSYFSVCYYHPHDIKLEH